GWWFGRSFTARRFATAEGPGGLCLQTGRKPTESSAVPTRIYLDHNATAPVRSEVVAAVAETLSAGPGNPSSVHAQGRRARTAVENARGEVAALLGVGNDEIVFTSGGT